MSDAMQPGSVIAGRYHLLEAVAEGGIAIVWRAVVKGAGMFERYVAIKVMKRAFSSEPSHIEMFLEEARIGAELQHPHLIQVLDFLLEDGGSYCLVMEWIEGIDLRSLSQRLGGVDRPLPWSLVAHIGVGVLRGLASAHERRLDSGALAPVIHRDVAPQNVLLGLNGSIKLTDFGMSRAKDRAQAKTAPGFVKGTLSYMAPEILAAEDASPKSDQFSLACTLWESLAGERLFDAPTDVEVYTMIRSGEVRSLEERRPDLPEALIQIVHKALAMEPDDRFESAREMIHELREVLRNDGPKLDADLVIGRAVAQAREAE